MRFLFGEVLPSCQSCPRRLPSLDVSRLLTLGWWRDSEDRWFCPICAVTHHG